MVNDPERGQAKMRLAIVSLLLLFSCTAVVGQSPEWSRVYTLDDSIIEMNTSLLTVISKDVTRVRFRWTFDEPQAFSRTSTATYKSILEVIEFNCSQNRARPFHVTYLNPDGSIARIDDSPSEWRTARGMLEKLFVPACDLIEKKTNPKKEVKLEELELERVTNYAYKIARRLEKTKDFQAIVDQFFIANYLNNYLQDKETNWFLFLDRATAERATYNDLQRFYIALMNSGYVGSLYVIGRTPSNFPEQASLEDHKKLFTPDVWRLISNHSYTAAYKDEDFLAQQIKDIQQLRSYTDLLEKTVALMRQHIRKARVENSEEYREIAEEWNLYQPRVRVCAQACLGLPSGTKLFAVNIPVFSLQIAEISGQLRVISATYTFQ